MNSTSQAGGNDSSVGLLVPFAISVGIVAVILLLWVVTLYARRSATAIEPSQDASRGRDLEAATRSAEEPINMRVLDNTNPPRKYREAKLLKGFKRQATSTSVQSQSSEVCAICLESFSDLDDVRRLTCNHVFHVSCIDNWYQKHHTNCPLCNSNFVQKHADSSPGLQSGRE